MAVKAVRSGLSMCIFITIRRKAGQEEDYTSYAIIVGTGRDHNPTMAAFKARSSVLEA